MTATRAGVLLAMAHAGLVASLGLKLLVDRARLPHGWVRTQPFDPSTPLRGRYVRLGVEVPLSRTYGSPTEMPYREVRLSVRDDRLVADPAEQADQASKVRVEFRREDSAWTTRLTEPIAFFIPEHVPDPSRRPPGEELWAEVTVPRTGPPRPIRLGVMRNGQLTPLTLR
jgi:hypothetical protein